jgi:Ca2+-binding EF-hand superfamily protein
MDPASSFLITKMKAELRERGGSGFHALQRKFRIMDDDGSKTLSMAEFKKAMKEMNFEISDKELGNLYRSFDVDESGSISFEEFIQGLRDPLTERRKQLVIQAFGQIDVDGSGIVDADEVKDKYDVSQHPDYIAGKRTKFEILEEFLSTFESGGEKDGKVTMDEFLNYYTNLGASIDNEDYFELMIRNAWHLSGGKGAAANSANKRVLVTNADGSQQVVEIQNDLGMEAGNEEDAIARLKAQGFSGASSVSFGSSSEHKNKSKTNNRQRMLAQLSERDNAPLPPSVSSSPTVKSAAGVSRGTNAFNSSIGGLIQGESSGSALPPPPPKISTQIFNAADGSAGTFDGSNVNASKEMPYGVSTLVLKMKEQLKTHGAHGYHGISRKFKIMDDDGSGKLSLGEFKKGLKELELTFTDAEIRLMFNHFDFYNTGEISFEEFLQSLRDNLTERRLALVKLAFDTLDTNGNGVLEPSELMDKYDASQHPEVLQGKKTETQVLKDWLSVFEVGGTVDGMVTYQEFVEYYQNLSANIDNDDYFELMIRNAWHIAGGEGSAANTANRRVLVTKDDGSQEVMTINNDMGKDQSKEAIMNRVRAQDAHASSLNLFGGGDDGIQEEKSPVKRGLAGRRYVAPKVDAYQTSLSSVATMGVLGGGDPVAPSAYASIDEEASPRRKAPQSLSDMTGLTLSKSRNVHQIIKDLRASLAERGARGIIGLSRKFKIMDDNGNKSLSMSEFKKAMKECELELTPAEVDAVFKFFDRDGSLGIDFEEFLQGIRGPMSPARLRIIKLAFDMLDADGSGILEPAELMDKYDTSMHPDVIDGKKTRTQVLREFLETFEVGEEVDGKVTYQEFENYYANISVSIDDDQYFELMMRNAWHISGGEGAAANSSNIRVLATDADGNQSVVEVKNDLGLKRGDKEATMAMLKKQGFNASSISFGDGVDDNKPATKANNKSRFGGMSADSPFATAANDLASPGNKRRSYGHNANKSSITF